MNHHTEKSSSPITSKEPAPGRSRGPRDRGYALLIIMMLATILLISLTAALPSIYVAGQREREEELIFRGTEYARAIALYRRQFGRYPTSVDDLLKRTNGIRFLRRAYPDPMSRKGKWRFIHADVNGALLDSRTVSPPPSARGPAPAPQSSSTGSAEETPEPSAFFGSETRGAFIAGVASSSRRESIRVWNNHTHYDEWEFLALTLILTGTQPTPPAQPSAPGAPSTPLGPASPIPSTPGMSSSPQ